MRELSKLTTTTGSGVKLPGITPAMAGITSSEESRTKQLGTEPPATGSVNDDEHGPTGGRMLGQYHAEGGLTDGCYALYNNNNVGQLDQVLTQIKVGWNEGGRR